MTQDYTPSFIMLSAIDYFYETAKKFKEDAITLKNNTSTCTPSFHLLSSLAIELFPKVLISLDVCLMHKNQNKEQISTEQLETEICKKQQQYSHNLKTLYENFPDLMRHLSIKNIEEIPKQDSVNKGFVWQYNFYLEDHINPIMIKHVEAARYGAFANKRDVAVNCVDDSLIIYFLEKLDKFVISKIKETNEEY